MQGSLTANPVLLRLRQWWQDPSIRVPVLLFAAARLLTLGIGVMALQAGPIHNPYASDPIYLASLQGRQFNGPLYSLIEPWHRWDTGWYMKVALQGYAPDDGTIIFAPLYPALMKITGAIVGDVLLGGLLVSSVACLAFLLIFYRLARRETGSDAAAQNTLLALLAFPTAFYLLSAYTEGTLLAFTAGALFAAQHRRWWIAALLAAAAALTRLQGWVLFFPLGWLALIEAPRFWQAADIPWSHRLRMAIPRLAAVGAGPLASLAFFVFISVSNLGSIGDAYENPWGMMVRPPWAAVIDVFTRITAGATQFTEVTNLIALVFIVVMALWSVRVLPFVYHLYIWPTLVLILLRYYPLYLLNGTMRYVLDFFPVFIPLGLWLRSHPRMGGVLIVVGVILQSFLLFLFARWMWIA
jgi:hypothetical protein